MKLSKKPPADAICVVALNIDDAVLVEIGKIVVLFNEMDLVLSGLIRDFITCNGAVPTADMADILTAEMSFGNKVAAANSLIRLFGQIAVGQRDLMQKLNVYPTWEVILSLWDRVRIMICEAEQLRNSIVHSNISVSCEDPAELMHHKVTAKQKRGLDRKLSPFVLADLRDTANFVSGASAALAFFAVGIASTDEVVWDGLENILASWDRR
jgi:hypothetical protein